MLSFPAASSIAQVVNDDFPAEIMVENFDGAGAWWPIVNTADNLFIIQGGEYILHRKNPNSPYAILCNRENFPGSFRLKAALKIEQETGKDNSAGLVFMAQPDGKGAFVAEINTQRQYRLKQLVGGTYRFITGDLKSSGWVKSPAVAATGASNVIEVRSSGNNYDLYINDVFINTFSEPSYRPGKMGFMLGPSTRVRVDYFLVYSSQGEQENNTEFKNESSVSQAPSDASLADAIIKLKSQINRLSRENDDLHRQLAAMETQDKERKDADKAMKALDSHIRRLTGEKDSLQVLVDSLKQYRDIVTKNENGDIIINLSRSLQAEKEKNTKLLAGCNDLKQSCRQLQDSLQSVKTQLGALKKTTSPAPSRQPADTVKRKTAVVQPSPVKK